MIGGPAEEVVLGQARESRVRRLLHEGDPPAVLRGFQVGGNGLVVEGVGLIQDQQAFAAPGQGAPADIGGERRGHRIRPDDKNAEIVRQSVQDTHLAEGDVLLAKPFADRPRGIDHNNVVCPHGQAAGAVRENGEGLLVLPDDLAVAGAGQA